MESRMRSERDHDLSQIVKQNLSTTGCVISSYVHNGKSNGRLARSLIQGLRNGTGYRAWILWIALEDLPRYGNPPNREIVIAEFHDTEDINITSIGSIGILDLAVDEIYASDSSGQNGDALVKTNPLPRTTVDFEFSYSSSVVLDVRPEEGNLIADTFGSKRSTVRSLRPTMALLKMA
ncbi:hypothetical protein KM043_004970 [Ampulex compressa]|nr:hypothetical protein KM043_004970 [Ampulex compressa]